MLNINSTCKLELVLLMYVMFAYVCMKTASCVDASFLRLHKIATPLLNCVKLTRPESTIPAKPQSQHANDHCKQEDEATNPHIQSLMLGLPHIIEQTIFPLLSRQYSETHCENLAH